MKVGLFGGSFNPFHKGHLNVINQVLDKKIVDEVWVVPCKNHPFGKNLEKVNHRVKMINLAIKNNPKIKLNKIELNSKGKNYTIKTLNKLKKQYKHEFFFIIGSDILYEITKWHGHKSLLEKTKFIITKRNGYPLKDVKDIKIYNKLVPDSIVTSSSSIRDNIFQNKSFKRAIPKKVEGYIIKNNLYKNGI